MASAVLDLHLVYTNAKHREEHTHTNDYCVVNIGQDKYCFQCIAEGTA